MVMWLWLCVLYCWWQLISSGHSVPDLPNESNPSWWNTSWSQAESSSWITVARQPERVAAPNANSWGLVLEAGGALSYRLVCWRWLWRIRFSRGSWEKSSSYRLPTGALEESGGEWRARWEPSSWRKHGRCAWALGVVTGPPRRSHKQLFYDKRGGVGEKAVFRVRSVSLISSAPFQKVSLPLGFHFLTCLRVASRLAQGQREACVKCIARRVPLSVEGTRIPLCHVCNMPTCAPLGETFFSLLVRTSTVCVIFSPPRG